MEGSRSPYGIGRRVDGNPETNDLVSRGEPSLENVPFRSREDILEIDAGPSDPSPSSRSKRNGALSDRLLRCAAVRAVFFQDHYQDDLGLRVRDPDTARTDPDGVLTFG